MKHHNRFCGRRHAGLLRTGNQSHEHLRRIACAYLVIANTSLAHKIPLYSVLRPGRGRARISGVRQIAQYLCHTQFGIAFTEVGHIFGRDRTSIAHACQRIEEWRDVPAHNLAMNCLEAALHDMAETLGLTQ